MSTSPERTPRLAPEVRRRMLLDAALDLMTSEGSAAVTVEAVARRASVTRPVVYDQFGDLNGLLLALFDREEEQALGPLMEIVGAPPGDVDPDAFLVESVHRFLTAVRERPRTWRLVLMPPDGGSPELRARIQVSRRRVVDRVAYLVAWGLDRRGGPAHLDAALLGRLLVAIGEDAARLVVAHPDTYSPERLAQATRALVALAVPDADRGRGLSAIARAEGDARTSAAAADSSGDAGAPDAARSDADAHADRPPTTPPGAAPPADAVPAGRRIPMAQRREQLLEHALELIADEGFDALTVEALARRAAVNRVVVYRAFGSLHVLLLTLLKREERRLTDELDALVPADPGDRTPADVMASVLQDFVKLVLAHPQTWRVALLRPESAPKQLQALVARRRAALAERLRPVVRWGVAGLDAPVAADLDVDLLARLLLSAGEELGRIALSEPAPAPAQLRERVAELVAVLPWR